MTLPIDLDGLTIRPAVPEDAAHIVALYNLQEADSMPQTVIRYAEERAKEADRSESYVAVEGERLLGYGNFHWAWWTGQPDTYSLEIRVAPDHSRRGIGTKLFDALRSHLRLRRATNLLAWVRDDPRAGRDFAAHLGFYETGQVIQEYRLDISKADTKAYPALKERLAHEGLRIACLADLPEGNSEFLRAIQRLWADSGDLPPDEDQLRSSFEAWRQEVLEAPGLSPDTHWIALEGTRPVGMTFLKRLSENAFENDYTGVAATHRGRGIATALKLQAIAWAQQKNVESFYTSSEVGNQAMIGINTRVGYMPGAKRREFTRRLP